MEYVHGSKLIFRWNRPRVEASSIHDHIESRLTGRRKRTLLYCVLWKVPGARESTWCCGSNRVVLKGTEIRDAHTP